jgi:hypothetical protein
VESDDTITYEIECWDPGNKWIEQDVFNHMGESMEQMFICFKVKSEDQQYKIDVLEKVKDTFPLKLEMKKFKGNEAVKDNFRRQGHVPGGGCVKFFRNLCDSSLFFCGFLGGLSFHLINMELSVYSYLNLLI